MNRVFNHYGAIRHDNGVGQMVDQALMDCGRKLTDLACAYDLDPIELRGLGQYVETHFNGKFAELVLRKAMDIKKAERKVDKQPKS